jgi:hypothetical protein
MTAENPQVYEEYFLLHLSSLSTAWFGYMQKKNPAAGCGSNLFCGERGIRTPGSVVTDQRFSRPPHSTALPFLLIGHSYYSKTQDRCICRGVYPALRDHFSLSVILITLKLRTAAFAAVFIPLCGTISPYRSFLLL